jgi:hypothetical protein
VCSRVHHETTSRTLELWNWNENLQSRQGDGGSVAGSSAPVAGTGIKYRADIAADAVQAPIEACLLAVRRETFGREQLELLAGGADRAGRRLDLVSCSTVAGGYVAGGLSGCNRSLFLGGSARVGMVSSERSGQGVESARLSASRRLMGNHRRRAPGEAGGGRSAGEGVAPPSPARASRSMLALDGGRIWIDLVALLSLEGLRQGGRRAQSGRRALGSGVRVDRDLRKPAGDGARQARGQERVRVQAGSVSGRGPNGNPLTLWGEMHGVN